MTDAAPEQKKISKTEIPTAASASRLEKLTASCKDARLSLQAIFKIEISTAASASRLGKLIASCRSSNKQVPQYLSEAERTMIKLTWLVLGGDPAVCSHRVEQLTAL